MKTEDEARKCLCPVARERGGVTSYTGADSGGATWPARNCCVASGCMFWRWGNIAQHPGEGTRGRVGDMGYVNIPKDWHPTRGFCGLAGK